MLKVTNKHNNRSVTVRVNDRGPFVSARIIDVSLAAAEQIDIVATGTAPVLVESVTQIALPSLGTEAAPWRNLDTEPLPASPNIPVYDDELGGMVLKPLDAPPSAAAATPQNRTGVRTIPTPEVYPDSALTPMIQSLPEATTGKSAPAAPLYYPAEPAPAVSAQAVPAAPAAPVFRPAPKGEPVSLPPAVILPGIPPAGDGKLYRIQVGSYKVPRNAADAFEKLKKAGLNPAYERNGEFYRVVVSKVRSDEVQAIAGKLGTAGFREALIRAEN
jgi:rare lipoprotein A